jgi:hypothetical protein
VALLQRDVVKVIAFGQEGAAPARQSGTYFLSLALKTPGF